MEQEIQTSNILNEIVNNGIAYLMKHRPDIINKIDTLKIQGHLTQEQFDNAEIKSLEHQAIKALETIPIYGLQYVCHNHSKELEYGINNKLYSKNDINLRQKLYTDSLNEIFKTIDEMIENE